MGKRRIIRSGKREANLHVCMRFRFDDLIKREYETSILKNTACFIFNQIFGHPQENVPIHHNV